MSNALTTLYVQFDNGKTYILTNLTEEKAAHAYHLVTTKTEDHYEFEAGRVTCVSYEINNVMHQWDWSQGHIVVDWAAELFGDDAYDQHQNNEA